MHKLFLLTYTAVKMRCTKEQQNTLYPQSKTTRISNTQITTDVTFFNISHDFPKSPNHTPWRSASLKPFCDTTGIY